MQAVVHDLVGLGFTEVEAKAYCELLRTGPLTGYRLASAIDKAPSNIYQTLDSLSRKGAVLADNTEPKTFRAVPATELLSSLERGFKRRKQGALQSLRAIPHSAPLDRFYSLRTVEQTYERARMMLGKAKEIVLFDLFPQPLRVLNVALQKAASRGVVIGGIGYGPQLSQSFLQMWNHPWDLVANTWPGLQVTVVVDARECLIALLSKDGEEVKHSMWTDSVYLSCLQHSGLACEIQVAAKKREVSDPIVTMGLITTPPIGLRILAREAENGPAAYHR